MSQDETGYLLQNDLPAVDADEADILRGNPAGSSSAGGDGREAAESFSASASFKTSALHDFLHEDCMSISYDRLLSSTLCLRIVFPSLQQNASPLSILPAFLEVLGRKIDNIEDVVDWGS